jgi:hypothetical protein
MAKEKSAWSRLDERETERESARSEALGSKTGPDDTKEPSVDPLDASMSRIESMIEKVQNLYQQYLLGVEKSLPQVMRKQLEDQMKILALQPKISRASQFKYQNLSAKFVIYRERWDKILKDLETGKIRRTLK